MNRKLLQKVEELTLYLIDQQKELTQLMASNVQFQEEMNELKAKIK
jgi:cell division protein FtsB